MAQQYLTIDLPPGVAKGGTDYNTKNAWANSQLVRYYAGTHQPVGGWALFLNADGVTVMNGMVGVCRACLAWRPDPSASTDDGPPYMAFGTSAALDLIAGQTLYGITPTPPTVITGLVPFPPCNLTGNGTLATIGATVNGQTTITFGSAVLTGTTQLGDKMTIAGNDYEVESYSTAAGNQITCTISPGSVGIIANGTGIAYQPVGQVDSAYTNFPPSGSFGASTFGSGAFGVGGTTAAFTWATTWSLDTLGQYLIALPTCDGHLYVWQNNVAVVAARPKWGPVTTGSIVTSGATAANSPTIAITATTLTGTVLQGQTFTISGVLYTALASATAAANIVTVQVAPLAPAAGIPATTAVTGTDTQAPDGICAWVTPEGYLMVGGANNVARRVAWADRRSFTQWGATAYNTAGSFDIATAGKILAGKRTRNQTLIWTDVDVWAATWIGAPLVYRFDQVGDHCGAISRNAMTVSGTQALWMGNNSFWIYDGYTRQLPCPCKDFVFNNINLSQGAKIWSMAMPEFGEVWWFYPSSNATEIDSYVMYNQWESEQSGQPTWYIGTLARTAGSAEQAFGTAQYPFMTQAAAYPGSTVNASSILTHEYLSSRSGEAPASLQSGPIELGQGDTVYDIDQILVDEKTLGDTTLAFSFANAPGLPTIPADTNQAQTPQTQNAAMQTVVVNSQTYKTQPTDVRITARQVELTVTEANATQWRFGKPRLRVRRGGER